MEFESYFPIWDKLTSAQQEQLKGSAASRMVKKGTALHSGSMDCTGLLLVRHGQLRAYILSDEGREITLYRLFDRDICLFSASCMMRSIQFEMMIEAEKDTELWIVPAEIYQSIMQESTPGPIAINCATYVGYKMAGMTGAVLATLGIVLPSFVILYFISMFLEHFLEYQVIAAACRGIKVGVSLLILDAGATMLKKMKKKPQPRIIAGCAFVIMLLGNLFSLRISSVALMLAAGIISLSVFAAKSAPAQRGGAGQ